MAAESKDDYYTKTAADAEFLTSSEAEEEFATKDFVEVILDQTPFENLNILWEAFVIKNNNYTTINATVYGGKPSEDCESGMYFFSSENLSSSTLIGSALPWTQTAGDKITGIVDVPEGTVIIAINNRTSGTASALANGYNETGRLVDVEDEIKSILNQDKKVQDGLIISVVGASTSTKINKDAYEITITEEDIGVPLSAYLTYYDYYGLSGTTPVGLTIGGHTFTADEIGQEVSFVPTAEDVGKSLGLALRYAGNDNKKVWWEYFEDLGAIVRPVCWSGSSITAHEESVTIRRTAHSWHDAQIRKIGVRIPGSMQRKAPDIIIITRGVNDMTHSPYGLLTDGYFDNWDWSYPTTDVVTGGWGIKEGLSLWVKKVRDAYPYAKIVIASSYNYKRINCSKFPVNNGLYSNPQLNDALREAANFFGCHTIDLDRNGMTFENIYPEYIEDSAITPTHPNNKGHWMIARQAIIDLESKLDFLHLQHEDHNSKLKMKVTYDLDNATSSNMSDTIALGETYTTTIAPVGNITVSVKQNGADITNTVYNASTGVVTINPVDGNISITAEWTGTAYNITNTLTHVSNTNTRSKTPELNPYSGELVSEDGYIKDSVTITMGGTDVTSTVYSDGFINIPSVTGDVIITASATQTIGGSYRIFNSKTGVLNGASPTQYNMNGLSKAVVKFHTDTTLSGGNGTAFAGIYGKIFTALYGVNGHVEVGTGGSALTGYTLQPETDYISVLSNINQAESTITLYAGNDEGFTTPLGTANRTATNTYPFALQSTYTTTNTGYLTKGKSIYIKLYDTSNNLIRDYVPATRLSDSVPGSYDRLTGEFVPLSVDQ